MVRYSAEVRDQVQPRRLASLDEGAKYVGCSVRTLRRFIAQGHLRAYRLGTGQLLRIDLNDIDNDLCRPVSP